MAEGFRGLTIDERRPDGDSLMRGDSYQLYEHAARVMANASNILGNPVVELSRAFAFDRQPRPDLELDRVHVDDFVQRVDELNALFTEVRNGYRPGEWVLRMAGGAAVTEVNDANRRHVQHYLRTAYFGFKADVLTGVVKAGEDAGYNLPRTVGQAMVLGATDLSRLPKADD